VRTPLKGFRNQLWNVLGARTLSTTGRQLFLIDKFRDTGRPLLSVLCDPNSVFMKGLATFQSRSLYTNITNDRSAVFYTTAISRTDPFSNLDAVKINYLPDYSPVLVDVNNPVSPKAVALSSQSWFGKDAKTSLLRLRLGLFFAVFIPIGSVLFLTNAVIQSVRSNQRIRAHAAGDSFSSYQVPLVMARMRETVEGLREQAEEVFEQVNAAHGNEYLSSDEGEGEGEALLGKDETKVDQFTKVGKMEFPTLALLPSQFTMVRNLDDLGWISSLFISLKIDTAMPPSSYA
jgi:hypothetical protein